MKKNNNLIKSALIAAVYTAFSLIFQPLSFGPLQLRVSEAVSVLALYTPSACWGLFIGCVLTNIFSPYGLLDAVVGSLATLVAAALCRMIKNKHLALLPFVLVNAFAVAFVISFSSGTFSVYWANVLYLALSEALSVYGLGYGVICIIDREPKIKTFLKD